MSAIRRATLIVLASAAGLSGCNQQEAAPPPLHARFTQGSRTITPIDVTRIDLGTAVRPDGTISQPTIQFKPTDTIMAAVTTQRPGHDIHLTARWMYGDDDVIRDFTKTISPSNIMVTDFQVTDGAGWPVGHYKLEMLVNGTLVAVTSFAVNR